MKYTNDSDLPELTDEKFMATRTTVRAIRSASEYLTGRKDEKSLLSGRAGSSARGAGGEAYLGNGPVQYRLPRTALPLLLAHMSAARPQTALQGAALARLGWGPATET